ncbi:hypothetical protein HDU87_006457 [Geranomyces variabilis]|uniref:Uncharacterized protein n=1 Tax=Geranomyces variabilis TaxID=109894 RepID=A0AAD5TKQ6_9FUNG|nr:hypothetical protein HDU87_006457 [Geranomyces variabilis]
MTRSTVGCTRLDFWINSSLNWSVELMRSPQLDLDSIKDYVDRFRENGRYYGLAKHEPEEIIFRGKAVLDSF